MAGDRLDDLLERLTRSGSRALPLHGDQVEVLESPEQFYQLLLTGLGSAQRHIAIVSLYFGTGGGRELEFADALAAAAHDTAARPQLQVRLLLDALRSTRPTKGPGAAAGAQGRAEGGSTSNSGGSNGSAAGATAASSSTTAQLTSTAEMLAVRLLEGQQQADAGGQHEPRVAVSLFHTPALRGLLKRVLPPRVSEIIGVQHMKCYVFDDTVILSGANISSTYLSTRQDRYIVIRSAPQLASLLRQVLDTVGRFSYQLHPLLPAAHAAEAGAGCATSDATLPAGDAGSSAAGSSLDRAEDDAGRRPRRRDVLLQLLKEQRLPWQQVGQLDQTSGRSWAQSLAALMGQQPGGSGQQPGGSGQLVEDPNPVASSTVPTSSRQAQQAQHEHHLKRHRSQLQQRYRLEACPAGVDPVRQAGLFSWRLQRELLPLFVAGLEEAQAWQQQQQQGSGQQGERPELPGAAGLAEGGAAAGGDSPAAAAVGGSPAAETAAATQQGQPSTPMPDTWLVPVVQAGFAGLRQEEQLTLATLTWAAGLPEAQPSWSGLPAAPLLGTRTDGGGSGRGSSGSSSASRAWRAAASWRGSASGGSSALVQLASPYLNLARPLERFLSRWAGSLDLELVTAAPEANGFFGSKGVSGMIPVAYSLLEQRTWRRLTRQQRRLAWRRAWEQPRDRDSSGSAWGPLAAGLGAPTSEAAPDGAGAAATVAGWPPAAGAAGPLLPGSGRRLYEYCRPGWEYHAKGIWISLPSAEGAGGSSACKGGAIPSPQSASNDGGPSRWAAPAVTSVGSSNHGWRSLRRDLELNFLLVTRNQQLQQALGREVDLLKSNCQEVLGDAHFSAPGRRATAAARLAVWLLRGFL